jgi:hypothetical protein
VTKWIAENQDFVLFTLMTLLVFLGYRIGSMCKKDEMQTLIHGYEDLLNDAYVDRQNLITALASIQGRTEGEYLGYRAAMKRMDNN